MLVGRPGCRRRGRPCGASWWAWFLPPFDGARIRPPLLVASVDGDIATTPAKRALAPLYVLATAIRCPLACCATWPPSHRRASQWRRWPITLGAALSLPPVPAGHASSILWELVGIARFVLASGHALRGLFLDNLRYV